MPSCGKLNGVDSIALRATRLNALDLFFSQKRMYTTTERNAVDNDEARRVMSISRLVWDHVLAPTIAPQHPHPHEYPDRETRPPSRAKCVWAMAVAEALFPLVPRACRAVLAASGPREPASGGGLRSSYFALECAAMAGGGSGGGRGSGSTGERERERGRCVRWLLGHRTGERGRRRREELAVLWGLCVGGHLGAATELWGETSSSFPPGCGTTPRSRWARDAGLAMVPPLSGDLDVRDAVASGGGKGGDTESDQDSILSRVCRAGHLAVGRWIVTRFGVEQWELYFPFLGALRGGHLDVAQWISGLIDVRAANDVLKHGILAPLCAARGGNLDVMKWCFGLFPSFTRALMHRVVKEFLKSKVTADEHVEGCMWLAQQFPKLVWELICPNEEKTMRWLLQSGLGSPRRCLFVAIRDICDVKLLQWIVDDLHEPLTLRYSASTVRNKKDSLEVVKFAFQRNANHTQVFGASQRPIEAALVEGNIAIADWLEETFHHCAKGRRAVPYSDASLYPNLEMVAEQIEQREVAQALGFCLVCGNNSGAMFLLEKFHIPHGTEHPFPVWKRRCLVKQNREVDD
ncbi:hypothetical protein Pelo_18800 [Pelomyxa schiedti]|nr:hypothetical protein Pelo_18800 [Pelomyxa schiedti]